MFRLFLSFQLASNVLVAISAIIMISSPGNYFALFFARLTAGVAHGIAYVTVVKHFGEICDNGLRGRIGTSLHLFMLKGGIISGSALMHFFSTGGRMDPNRFLGICSLSLSVIAILMTLTFYKESILTLVEEGRHEEAIETLMILRGKKEETPEIISSIEEFEAMIAEDKDKGSGIFQDGNARPLIVVTLLRIAFVLTFNYSLKHIHLSMIHTSSPEFDYTFVLNIVHTLSTFVVMFTIDNGRRKHFFLSATGTALIFIAFGAFRTTSFANDSYLVFTMLVALQLFAAIALGPTAHIYSTEAFSVSKKASSIAFTSILEYFTQILLIILVVKQGSSKHFDAILLLSSGIVLSAIKGYLIFNLPETKNLSIRETKNKFMPL